MPTLGKRKSSTPIETLEFRFKELYARVEKLEVEVRYLREEKDEESYHSDSDLDLPIYWQASQKPFNQVDIAYLYAVPLIKKENGHEYSMGLPIDYQTEIDEMV